MLYMVIERFTKGPRAVYERAAALGRMLPDGLRYIDSWIVDDADLDRCFQLMETDDPSSFDEWRSNWHDLMDFEIVPVIKSPTRRPESTWLGEGEWSTSEPFGETLVVDRDAVGVGGELEPAELAI